MGRKPRIEYRGAIYHVIQRGNNREYIFRDTVDKQYILEITLEYKKSMEFVLYGYVLMDNHYHMIIKTTNSSLQSIMHRINNRYSKYYNSLKSRTGHVFEGRYKSILVKDDRYLLSLLKYVHQNPVKAMISKNIKDYKWSSDNFYRKNKQNILVDIDFILDIFSPIRSEAIKAYHSFMDNDELEDSCVFEDADIIGEKKEYKLMHQVDVSLLKDTLDSILIKVTDNKKTYEDIKRGSRKRTLTIYKKLYIKEALTLNYTMKEIAENISISEAAVCKLYNKI